VVGIRYPGFSKRYSRKIAVYIMSLTFIRQAYSGRNYAQGGSDMTGTDCV
jgi:hypothetical protein